MALCHLGDLRQAPGHVLGLVDSPVGVVDSPVELGSFLKKKHINVQNAWEAWKRWWSFLRGFLVIFFEDVVIMLMKLKRVSEKGSNNKKT